MERKIKFILFFGILFLSSCDLDITGFARPYTSADKRFQQSLQWNLEHPERILFTTDSTYSILFTGDSHVGGFNNLSKFFDAADTIENLMATFIAGDITTGKSEDYLHLKNFLDSIQMSLPQLMVGNHDLYFNGWESFYKYFGSSTYTVKIATPWYTDLYICLDSGSGTLGQDQLNWFRNILKYERQSYNRCIVITHVNFFRNGMGLSTNPNVEEIHVLLGLMAEYNVDYVITGHDHASYVEVFGNTTYITMDAIVDGTPDPTVLQLTVNPQMTNFRFVDIE
jgi:predicted phosphodiesterase